MFLTKGKLCFKGVMQEIILAGYSAPIYEILFAIKKRHKYKPVEVAFIAKNENAKKINALKYNEKVRITFFPMSKQYTPKGGVDKKYFTELKVYDIEKYMPEKKMYENDYRAQESEAKKAVEIKQETLFEETIKVDWTNRGNDFLKK